MKIRPGKIFMALGSLLLICALVIFGRSIYQENQANEAVAEVLAPVREAIAPPPAESPMPEELPDYVLFPEMEMPTENIDGYDYIGLLSIPALELELPIISQWGYPELRVAPCRYTGSAYTDNLVLSAHNYQRHFGLINRLPVGSPLVFTDMDGNTFEYEVAEVCILEATAIEEMTSGQWPLTLFTCTQGGQARVTVRCIHKQV